MGDRVSNQEDCDAKTGDFGEIFSCDFKYFRRVFDYFIFLFSHWKIIVLFFYRIDHKKLFELKLK